MATYSAQCSAVGSFAYANYFKLYVELTEIDVDVANNRSKVKYNVYCKSSGSGSINANHFLYFNINGSDKRNETIKVNVASPNANIPIASGTTDYIGHNSGGDKKISYSAQIKASSYGVSASLSGEFTLTTIPRASSASGGSGNIGGTTTISISRASNTFTHTLRYLFGSLSGTIATGVGTSYTWTIPTSFYTQIPNEKTGRGTLYCDTYSGSTLIGTKLSSFTVTVTESSSGPTVSVTLTDTNATTKGLTGNASKMVKGKSTGQLVITSTVKNSATIKSVTINGTSAGTAESITKTYANISTASFTIVTTDSRGFSKSQVVTPSYVNYVPLTLNAKIFRPQQTGTEIQLTYSGNYFNASFGSVANTLSITWKYRTKGASSWTNGGTITPTLSGNTISSKTISLGTSYNYQTAYEFQIIAVDKLTTNTQTIQVPVGKPIFYWGKNFFNFTVSPYLSQSSGDTYYRSKRTDTGVETMFGVGAGGTNHGIYSTKLNTWLIHADDSKGYLFGDRISFNSSGDLNLAGTLKTSRKFIYTLNATTDKKGTFYKLVTLPKSDEANATSVYIKGSIGGWSKGNKATISLQISNREGLKVFGTYIGNAAAFNEQQIVVYKKSDESHAVYIKNSGSFTGPNTLEISVGGYNSFPSIVTNYENTTTPTGTLEYTSTANNVASLNGPIVLYDDATGTTGTLALTETSANFKYLEIFFNCTGRDSIKTDNPDGKTLYLTVSQWVGSKKRTFISKATISGVYIGRADHYFVDSDGYQQEYTGIYITKVLGYR